MQAFGVGFEKQGPICRFWAPGAKSVELIVRGPNAESAYHMKPDRGDVWSLEHAVLQPGVRYAFKVDGKGPYPDPASRSQPDGVHEFSQAIDTRTFLWKHPFPHPRVPARRSIYELHVGTFSPEGTFEGARQRLSRIQELGVSHIEIMPVADFPGSRNWGYDGVSLFAPARVYGTPGELAALVDEAHGLGLGVILDVVYNHFGPDGNYLRAYNPCFFDSSQKTPWGEALNFSGPGHQGVRDFFLANALYWLKEFRFDGLRLDATHAYCDGMERPFTAELRRTIDEELPGRTILLYAEDDRRPARFCHPLEKGGSGFDGLWADDWHHHVRRRYAGDCEGYFAKYDATLPSLAKVIQQGWEKDPQGRPGSAAPPLPYECFVFCLQNHDQIGNRASGERLHHQISSELYRALSGLLVMCPETPLLFMGQEWAATTPFLYFTDHKGELGKAITEGRRHEFLEFSQFRDSQNLESIPDPQRLESFTHSKLKWEESVQEKHASTFRFYKALLKLRAVEPALGATAPGEVNAVPVEPDGLILHRRSGGNEIILAAWFGSGPGRLVLPPETAGWETRLTSEMPGMTPDPPQPVVEKRVEGFFTLGFSRAGVWIARKPLHNGTGSPGGVWPMESP